MPRKRLIVKGRVQGVGFRHFTRIEAAKHGITGFVRNKIDGSVLIEAQGDSIALESFAASMHIGPSYAEITTVEIFDLMDKNNESGFVVTF